MKRKTLLPTSAKKPQNQISSTVRKKVLTALEAWFASFNLDILAARLISEEVLHRAISDRIRSTSDTAPSVLLTDIDKIETLIVSAKKIADSLDQEGELESIVDDLVSNHHEHGDGNSL